MHRNPIFTLIVGAMLGLVVGFFLGERQSVPPAGGLERPRAAAGDELPDGHPPIQATGNAAAEGQQALAQQAASLERVLAQNPRDSDLMVALGNLYFDAGRWHEARMWYEQALEIDASSPDVNTDLAVVYRNLEQYDRALEILDQAKALDANHWQSWYNTVVILHFDQHRHDEAAEALNRLQMIANNNPNVPDLTELERQVLGN